MTSRMKSVLSLFFKVRLVYISTLSLAFASAQASNPLPSNTAILSTARIVGTINSFEGPDKLLVGKLLYASGGKLQTLMQGKNDTFYLPTFSPDGNKIAFAVSSNFTHPDTALDGADVEIVVIDIAGRTFSKVLVHPRHLRNGTEFNSSHIQGVQRLQWMGNDKVVIVGYKGPVLDFGYVIPILYTGDAKPNVYDEMHDAPEFKSVGPLGVSAGGLHIASVSGLTSSTDYESCASVGESIQIDGEDIPLSKDIPSFSVVSGFAWKGDGEVSTIVRTSKGPTLLTITGIAESFIFKPSAVATDINAPNFGDIFVNPPTVKLNIVHVPTREIDDAFYDLNYIGNYLYFRQYSPSGQVLHRIWRASTDVRNGSVHQVDSYPTIDGSESLARQRDELRSSLIATLPADVVQRMSSEDIWCGNAVLCGSLASGGSISETRRPAGTKVPVACLPPDYRVSHH